MVQQQNDFDWKGKVRAFCGNLSIFETTTNDDTKQPETTPTAALSS
jgi:hypothetical protein